MADLAQARAIALALPGTTEAPHFEATSFRVRGRIFATAPPDGSFLNVFVDEAEVDGYVAELPGVVEPLLWGQRVRGVHVLLAAAPEHRVRELLAEAWRRRAPKRLVAEFDAAG